MAKKTGKAKADRSDMLYYTERESWLRTASAYLVPLFDEKGFELPENIRFSCGWPSKGSKAKAIGECWASTMSKDGSFEIFISPKIDEPVEVLAILVHELIHAAVGLECGHKGQFRKAALALGLEGKMTATRAGEVLRAYLVDLAGKLGKYPHASLEHMTNGKKKQTTRLIKVECEACGYVVRTTQKWLETGVPTCCCGTVMTADMSDEDFGDDDGDE